MLELAKNENGENKQTVKVTFDKIHLSQLNTFSKDLTAHVVYYKIHDTITSNSFII